MITGKFLGGSVAASSAGTTVGASIELIDDVHGSVGQRSVGINDPAVIAQIDAFMALMLPTLSAAAGIEISLPVPAETPE